jgi:hypothetical protein
MKYPVTLTAPGVSLSSTIEVTRCQLTVPSEGGRFFRVMAKFYPSSSRAGGAGSGAHDRRNR